PDGIDVFFDNVGGAHLDAALALSRDFARFALCGSISGYDTAERSEGIRNTVVVVTRRLRLQGFIILDHFNELGDFVRDMGQWVAEGRIKWKETVVDGLDNAPAALMSLFKGANLGKMLVKL